MAKKKTKINDLIDDIKLDISDMHGKRDIPDIITFVESAEWLGLPHHPTNPLDLFPVQKIILKVFYRGSIGNEDLKLTDRELEICDELGLDDPDRGDLLHKYATDVLFRELCLVWGRRSGKDFVVSIIALYEAMKLLECPGGDPYSFYEISSANTINVLTVANSAPQSQIAFSEIREKLLHSPYFRDKYISDGIGAGSIYLLTPRDKMENKKSREDKMPLKKGSVGILVGHSNSDTLLGLGCMVLILDEVASFKTTGSASSGDRIYAALTPTVQTYVQKIYEKDENGEIVRDEHGQKIIAKRIYDGKIISISSPRAKEGKFYNLFKTSSTTPTRLSARLSTWEVNPHHTRDSLRRDNTSISETEFNMEYGAEFSGTALESFFTEEQIKPCFIGHSYKMTDLGSPGHVYFAHIDPATSSHNYALVVLHKEYFMNEKTNKADFKVIVDLIKYWQPINAPISIYDVDNYVVSLRRRFRLGLLTYDQWNSQESVLKLRKAGIPNKETRFTGQYKTIIYRELENLVNAHRLYIPYDQLLYNEMIELQRKFTPTGFKILPKKEGDGVKSDDIVDCLAGACYVAVEKQISRLPSSRLIELGNPLTGGNNISWRNMQGGTYGVGSGRQVSAALERRASWPNYRR